MYPKRKDRFVQWSKAMVEGATVDKPVYPGTIKKADKGRAKPQRLKRRKRRKRQAHGSKD